MRTASFPKGVEGVTPPLSDAKLYRRGRIDLELMAGDLAGWRTRCDREKEMESEGGVTEASRLVRNSITSFPFRYLRAESNYLLTFGNIIEPRGGRARRLTLPLGRVLRQAAADV